MAEHNELGKWGEELAVVFLQQRGHLILERNWRYSHREIDIISLDTKTQKISFVEVKTRRNNNFSDPEDAITMQKLRFIMSAAACYIRSRGIDNRVQVDIIGIVGTPQSGYSINYTPDISLPSTRSYNYRSRYRRY